MALSLALAPDASPRIVLAVEPGIPDAGRLADDLAALSQRLSPARLAGLRIYEFPSREEGDKGSAGRRLKAVAAIRAWSLNPYPCIVAASYPALCEAVPSSAPPPVEVAPGAAAFGQVRDTLVSYGYERAGTVSEPSQWSVRGGIVDFWPPGEDMPYRAEFEGEKLESLRTFDPATQLSVAPAERAAILPSADASGDVSLAEILPAGSAALLAVSHAEYDWKRFDAPGRFAARVFAGDPPPAFAAPCAFQTAPLPGFGELGASEAHHPELFDQARARLERHLEKAASRGVAVLAADELSGGFEIAPGEDGRGGLAVVAKSDRVFAKRRIRAARAPARGARLSDFEELEPGELVVHVDYGIGRFVGSSEISTGGAMREVFTVEYADGAKLHVPASHAHLLSRYVGVKGKEVQLHRLDGKRWSKDKADAEKAVADLASSLLETQARRQIAPGFAYDVHCDGRDAFDAAFPFEETPDQLAAIRDIENDMASSKPMDRLVCGDAGYGKTEVAMRAAYIAAMNGKQTAVLAPTTVLAEQHYETFVSRFDGTPVRIEPVSRFQTAETHEGTFKRLESGVCDIVIGTHAILSSKVRFHDLGLVIIDEEQRFGVRQKEWLKRLKETADVLTMSATPIPRTLYLSMTGARDLSLLRSPPRERVAVETSIVRDSDAAVRAAIDAELARGGQVFFLHNRVATIEKVAKRLESIRPGLRLVVAHGQMDSATLAKKMRDFERGEYDVLLSTTIIESGIDIPRANTIIVSSADMFGLADLYQLRGRVGRSSVRGRAIFLLPPSGDVDSDARERLAALKRHGGLGAGFGLAVRDLELRGAGNLLGSKQSGHIAAVGFTLYCRLLKRTVAILKGEKPPEVAEAKINLDFVDFSPDAPDSPSAAAIPYSYIEEDSQRIGFMRRIAEAEKPREFAALEAELADRFGRPPASVKRLLRLARLRALCEKAGVSRIDAAGGRAVFDGASGPLPVYKFKSASPDGKIRELEKILAARR